MEPARHRLLVIASIVALLAMSLMSTATAAARGSGASPGDSRSLVNGGTIAPSTGSFVPSTSPDLLTDEFAGDEENDEEGAEDEEFDGEIVDRTLSGGNGAVNGVSANSGIKAKSD